jgi:hypothetical protein
MYLPNKYTSYTDTDVDPALLCSPPLRSVVRSVRNPARSRLISASGVVLVQTLGGCRDTVIPRSPKANGR